MIQDEINNRNKATFMETSEGENTVQVQKKIKVSVQWNLMEVYLFI